MQYAYEDFLWWLRESGKNVDEIEREVPALTGCNRASDAPSGEERCVGGRFTECDTIRAVLRRDCRGAGLAIQIHQFAFHQRQEVRILCKR